MPSICLCMMVKNEAAYLSRSLRSIKPFIDRYSILDTGSTDNTIQIINSELGSLPGTVASCPWYNWGYNRTAAINLARTSSADFIFVLDADEEVHDLVIPELDFDSAYWINVKYGSISYDRPNLLSSKHIWEYVGVTHEYLHSPSKLTRQKLPGYLLTHPDRADKSSEKCAKDAELLEEALKTEPNNSRYVFYLAQSYKDSNQPEKAIAMYTRRVEMGGWEEEVYLSLLRIAQLSEGRRTFPEVSAAYTEAHEYRPQRAGETLRSMARYCTWWANGTQYPKDDYLFVDSNCYVLKG